MDKTGFSYTEFIGHSKDEWSAGLAKELKGKHTSELEKDWFGLNVEPIYFERGASDGRNICSFPNNWKLLMRLEDRGANPDLLEGVDFIAGHTLDAFDAHFHQRTFYTLGTELVIDSDHFEKHPIFHNLKPNQRNIDQMAGQKLARGSSLFSVINASTNIVGKGEVQYFYERAIELRNNLQKHDWSLEVHKLINIELQVGSNFFYEVARIRSIRLAMEQVFRGACPYITAVCTVMPSKQEDQYANLIRTTTEAMSAVLGGADIIWIKTYNDHLDEQAQRWARNISHLLRYESRLDWVQDTASGSYLVEHLTGQLLGEIPNRKWDFIETAKSNTTAEGLIIPSKYSQTTPAGF